MTLSQASVPTYRNASSPISDRVQDLLVRMTLPEKVAQLGSAQVSELQESQSFAQAKAAGVLSKGIGQITRIGGGSTLDPRASAEMANAIQTYLVNHTRLGIPAIVHEECCSGYMALGATCFPQMIGLASTWAPELVEAMTTVIRTQMRAVGAHQGLAPVLDIARDPRWGRVEETFGEDPTLAAQMGMAYVRGLQGPNLLREGIMATGKHFGGHGISEGGMNCTPVHFGPRELRNVFLMPFEAVIRKEHLASMMNAYSEVDGEVVAASRAVMTDLLRGELGFDGVVVSDYRAIPMLNDFHNIAPDKSSAAGLALNAGIDIELPQTNCYGEPLLQALQAGLISESLIDVSVSRILQKKFELGLFENPYVDVKQVAAVYETPAQRALARQIAQQSIVLLKNEAGLLPLKKTLGVLAIIGPNANSARNLMGDYAYPPHIERLLRDKPELAPAVGYDPNSEQFLKGSVAIPSVLDAITQKVSPQTRVLFAQGCEINSDNKAGFDEALRVAQEAGVVILVVGDRSGLSLDCTSGETRDRADLNLPGVQEELVRAIAATGKPVIVVLVTGRPLVIPWIAEHIPAVVEAWLPGEEGGPAIADILFGDANPGGKLPMTFPRSVGQIPIFYNHKPSGGKSHWHGDYVSASVTPLFPFGHGLSYTQFEFSNLHIDPPQVETGSVRIMLDIKNVGARTGDEVVQLYIRDEFGCVPRPVKELKGFKRITIEPAETRSVVFDLPVDQLGFYDQGMRLIVEPGTIQVMVGSSSQDIRVNGSFEILGNQKRLVPARVFACSVQVV
jgi:beta-glucosidase